MADAQNPNSPARRRRRAARRAAGPPASVGEQQVIRAVEQGVAPPGSAQSGGEQSVGGRPGATNQATAQPVSTNQASPQPAEVPPAEPDQHSADVGVSYVVPADQTMDQAGDRAVLAHEPGTTPGTPGGHGSPADAPTHLPGTVHPGGTVRGAGGQGRSRDRTAEQATGRPNSSGEPPRRAGRSYREDAAERSLRSLVTTRSTQVSPSAALRAREVALPSADDLALAESELVIVRRHYVPPTVLAAGRRTDRPARRQQNEKDG